MSFLLVGVLSLTVVNTSFAYTLTGYKYSNATFTYNYDSLASGYGGPAVSSVAEWYKAPTPLNYQWVTLSTRPEITFTGSFYGDIGWNAEHRPRISSGYYVSSEITANYSEMQSMSYNERQGVFAHELGHSLGLDHVLNTLQVMCTWGDGRSVYMPGSDDIAGANYLY